MRWGKEKVMRHTVRDKQQTIEQEEPMEYSAPVSTVENPLMEELHTVSTYSAPAWKSSSSQNDDKKDPFASDSAFVSIDDELLQSTERPIAPTNATIISEEKVKEHFSYTDDQLVYKKGMKFSERLLVTFRKIAVWFSDIWDKYFLFIKRHFPALVDARKVKNFSTIGLAIVFLALAAIAIVLLIVR